MPKKEITSEDRLNIAISLINLLLAEGEVHFSKAAAHFEISEKALRDLVRLMNEAEDLSKFISFFYIDLDLLESENVLRLVEAEALNQLPKLTTQQMIALATGLDYLAGLPNFAADPEFTELREALSGSKAPQLESPLAIEQRLETLQNAVLQRRIIRCRYVNQAGETRTREIQPLRLDFSAAKHYLRGICEDSHMLKSFRVDRISEVELLDKRVTEDALALEIPDAVYGDTTGGLEVLVRVAPDAREFLYNYPLASRTTALENGYEAKIITGNLATLGRQVVKYGGKVEVLSPANARDAVREYAARVIAEVEGQTEGVVD